MSTQVAEMLGGVVVAVMLAGLAALVIVRRDDDEDPGCFVWMAGWVLLIVMASLFAAAGIK